jgi:hypothetical protein
MEIFKNNTYFYGLTIPDPGAIVPLEKKVPTDMATVEGMKFLKVLRKFLFYKLLPSICAIKVIDKISINILEVIGVILCLNKIISI